MAVYNLEERTALFGEGIIGLCKKVRLDEMSKPIVNQLIRSGTSVGAHYMEANGATSKRDFANKIGICKKEAQETKHWLRMLKTLDISLTNKIDYLWDECQQLVMIFQKIINTTRG